MKKFFSLLSAAGIAVIATGCASTHVSKTSAPLNVEMKKVIATPDVVGGEKVSGEATTLTVLGILKFGSTKFADGIVMQSSGGLRLWGLFWVPLVLWQIFKFPLRCVQKPQNADISLAYLSWAVLDLSHLNGKSTPYIPNWGPPK